MGAFYLPTVAKTQKPLPTVAKTQKDGVSISPLPVSLRSFQLVRCKIGQLDAFLSMGLWIPLSLA